MPISIDDLKQNFVEAPATVAIGQLLQQLPKERGKRAWVYVGGARRQGALLCPALV